MVYTIQYLDYITTLTNFIEYIYIYIYDILDIYIYIRMLLLYNEI